MTTIFIARVVVVSLLLACAALTAERVAAWYGRPRRWMWVAAIGASLVLPMLSNWTPDFVRRTRIVGRSAQIFASFEPTRTVNESPRRARLALSGATQTSARFDLSRVLEFVWIGLSLTMFAIVAVAYARLLRVRASSAPAVIDGDAVLETSRTGPAVIGILRPAIIVPRWVMHVSAEERRLIILHEREHIAGHDPQLLAFATLATIAMPWNVVLWWQYLRLRLALETDCDARVLARAGNCELYGRTLIRTAGETVAMPMIAPAWGEAASQLKRRILAMTARPPRARFALASTCVLVAGTLTLAACTAAAGLRNANGDTPRPQAHGHESLANPVAFALPGRGYVRVSGYTREHLRTRVVLSGAGASLERDSGSVTIRGDTLEGVTPVVFRVVTTGVPNYRLVAYAVEPGTEVAIDGVAPVGYGYPGMAGARGSYPMLNVTHDTIQAVPMPQATPLPTVVALAPPGGRVLLPDPPRPPSNYDPGAIRVESENGGRVSVRISSNISFRVRGAGISSSRSDGTVEIVTPSTVVLTGTGAFAIVFEPVDAADGIRVSADGRSDDGFVRATAWSAGRQADSTHAGGAIAVCNSPHKSAGIQGAARGTRAADVKCE